MSQIKTYLIFFTLITLVSNVFCQKDSTNQNDISHYFYDYDLPVKKNDVKINITSIINGDFSLFYERRFSTSFGVELGIGKTSSYYLLHPTFPRNYFDHIPNSNNGRSFSVQLKYYYHSNSSNCRKQYIGIRYRDRAYFTDELDFTIQEILLVTGSKLYIGKRYSFDYSIGLGPAFNNGDRRFSSKKIELGLPLDFKIELPF